MQHPVGKQMLCIHIETATVASAVSGAVSLLPCLASPRQNCDHEGRFAIDQYDRVRKARCLAVFSVSETYGCGCVSRAYRFWLLTYPVLNGGMGHLALVRGLAILMGNCV